MRNLPLLAVAAALAAAPEEPRLLRLVDAPYHASAVDAAEWRALSPDARLRRLHAATLAQTLEGGRQRACFTGASRSFITAFFAGSAAAMSLPGAKPDGSAAEVRVSASSAEDGAVAGTLTGAHGKVFHSFSLPPCGEKDLARLKESAGKTAPERDGFTIYDQPAGGAPAKPFAIKLDAPPDSDPRIPWLDKDLDLRRHDDALKLAVLVQRYMYEGMLDQSEDPEANLDAFEAARRGVYWCNVPWMNAGNAGHEAFHGFTKGHDLLPGDIPLFSKMKTGSSFQVAYHNAHSCKTIVRAFGTKDSPKTEPDFSRVRFEDGAFAFKPIFTQSPDASFKDAFTMKGHVSGPGSEHLRSVQDNRLIQIDVFLRDSRLKGTRPEVRHWVAVLYYYDPSYDYAREVEPRLKMKDPLAGLKLHPGLRKLRPAGIQLGLDAADTIPLLGAALNGFGGRLNGPQNINASSCMSCHARAGMKFAQTPTSEGVIMSNKDWLERIVPTGEDFDFGFQMNHARRNHKNRLQPPDFRLLQDYRRAEESR